MYVCDQLRKHEAGKYMYMQRDLVTQMYVCNQLRKHEGGKYMYMQREALLLPVDKTIGDKVSGS